MQYDIQLLTCSYRQVTTATVASEQQFRLSTKLKYTWGILSGDALIGRARSLACYHFLQINEAPYMLFIDDDIQFAPSDVERIYQDLVDGYDVIGGVYTVKGGNQLASYPWGGQHKVPLDETIMDVEYLATGFMGISRKILLKIRDELKLPLLNQNEWAECYPFFESGGFTDRDAPIYISEDWDFCEKVRKVGARVYMDARVKVGHLREQIYTVRDVYQQAKQRQLEEQIYGGMDKQRKQLATIENDLAEFLKIPVDKVNETIGQAQTKLADMWQGHKGSANDFYKDNREYLFDLAFFNKQPEYYSGRVGALVNLRGQKVLDIGCGIGTLAFMMADQGNEVVGWDINKPCIDFCNFRQSKNGTKVAFTTEMPDLSQFDLICAVDTLEHIEDLGGFLKTIGAGMKTGAKFYHSDYFPKGADGHDNIWPMHFEEHAEHLDKWLREANLIPWDNVWAVKA